VRRSARSGRMFAVIFIDLDDFKSINDRYGHGVGDELLTALGQRLTGVLRPADTLARFGGDEFVILCEDLDPSEGDELAERIAAQFRTPFELSRAALHVRASIGVALSSQHCDSPDGLLRAADEAMYAQKHTPRRERHRAGRRSGDDHRTETTDEAVAALNADDRHIGRWEERWIGGSVSAGCAFALVAFNADTGELLITEYDNRVLMLRRHEWQLVARHDRGRDDIELITTDWDGQELARHVVDTLPDPPADSRELERLLSARDGG
jgi:diguanylate cyclase (GGDEF)-like protein